VAEKRKPVAVFLLRFQGKKKRFKLEIFEAKLWADCRRKKGWHKFCASWNRYRLRTNGKWFRNKAGEEMSFLKYEIRDILWRGLPL
jgi:hypothetical protein